VSTIVQLLSTYGLVAVFAGCLMEGETAAIVGGFLAHQAVLSLPGTLAAAFAGSFLGDLGFFLAGRRLADTRLVRKLTERRSYGRARRMIADHPYLFILSNRFIYGLRTVGGLAAGMSGVGLPLFCMLNALSAVVWTGLFVSLGWTFGLAAEKTLGHLFAQHHGFVLAGIALVVMATFLGGATVKSRFRQRDAKK